MPRCELMTITSTISVKGAVLVADIKTKRTAAKQTHRNRTLLPAALAHEASPRSHPLHPHLYFNIHVHLNISGIYSGVLERNQTKESERERESVNTSHLGAHKSIQP